MIQRFGDIFEVPDLRKKVLFTLGAIAVYRVGAAIPIPGINGDALRSIFDAQRGGLLSFLNIFSGGALARFSRDAEREADNIGIQAMAAAGYNPNGMASMFEELLEHRRGQPSRVEQFFSTHPLTEERIQDARNRAQQIGNRGITDEPQFQDVQRRV